MAEAAAVCFLGVVRIRDQVTLASCFDKSALNEEKKGFEGALASIMERASTAYPGWRERAECRECDGVLHAFADAQGLCLVVAGIRDAQYPDRVVVQMLRELADKVKNSQGDEIIAEARAGGLSTPLRKLMRDLMKTYNDAGGHDKTTEVRQQVDQLKGIMQDNVKRILETHVTLEGLENSSGSMSTQANRFLRQSVDLRRQIQYRNLKIKAIAGLCVGAVVAYVVTMFVDF
mmetsp:Transcript_67202/g.190095  ORF Transcript_67202/g.190095 Transcript_67202/m.190095 type:complete len:232 (+) Transcript_67202:105-800(+)|eukprot:CAMPEP_0177217886 /NCGR_PEP_ID=MMETSP0367-20130122/35522_1 /TAXON_ID=447022 ORGANISM="Scrippsiella hangoei-like, Strain SHHI-4" /NCGR_SAMPLE_ID=MMETSP0367 /ASSEMBLY_ACC=CAM_ASM_000362 /LENGTH=231 /DNA_ID=CAMNT_0018667483 /DNA_START=35 /DNA_END=730 /DNA_ORIENTATION=+